MKPFLAGCLLACAACKSGSPVPPLSADDQSELVVFVETVTSCRLAAHTQTELDACLKNAGINLDGGAE